MYTFDNQWGDKNHFFCGGLFGHLFYILQNIITIVSTSHRGHSCECIIYVLLTVIDLDMGTSFSVVVIVWYEGMKLGEYVINVIMWLLLQSLVWFCISDLVEIVINNQQYQWR